MVHKTEIVDGHYCGCQFSVFEENVKTGNENENDSTHANLDSYLSRNCGFPTML